MNTANICAIESEELTRLSNSMQERFPNIHDMLGGIIGLLMMIHLNYKKSATDYCLHPDTLYEDLTSEAYTHLDAMVDTVAEDESAGEIGSSILEKEFISWDFSEFLMDTTSTYQELLRRQLQYLVSNKLDVEIEKIALSPIKNVYYLYLNKAG